MTRATWEGKGAFHSLSKSFSVQPGVPAKTSLHGRVNSKLRGTLSYTSCIWSWCLSQQFKPRTPHHDERLSNTQEKLEFEALLISVLFRAYKSSIHMPTANGCTSSLFNLTDLGSLRFVALHAAVVKSIWLLSHMLR